MEAEEGEGLRSEPKCIHSTNTYPINTLIFYIKKTQQLYRFDLSSAYACYNVTNLKMQSNKWKHKRLQILNKIIKDSQTLWILTFLHICQRPNLGRLKVNIGHETPQEINTNGVECGGWRLLTSNAICSFPIRISNSWRPSLFRFGHFASSSLFQLISIIKCVLHTSWFHSSVRSLWVLKLWLVKHTLFTR